MLRVEIDSNEIKVGSFLYFSFFFFFLDSFGTFLIVIRLLILFIDEQLTVNHQPINLKYFLKFLFWKDKIYNLILTTNCYKIFISVPKKKSTIPNFMDANRERENAVW